MVKKLKKIMSALLVLAVVFVMAVPVFAAGTNYSITIKNSAPGHTYEAYQIFKGDLSEDGILSNIEWGGSINGSGLLEALRAANPEKYGSCQDAAGVAEALSGGDSGATAADVKAFAKVANSYLSTPAGKADTVSEEEKYVISGLSAGYYLIKDKDNSLEGKPETYTDYIVWVLGNESMAPKAGVITPDKKVKDINDSKSVVYTDWQESADYDIGDRIPFKLEAALPANYSSYDAYELIFHDTENTGLTFDEESIKVFIDGKSVDSGYEVITDRQTLSDGCTFEVKFSNLKSVTAEGETKAQNNSKVTVEYESVLNEKAVIGNPGNPNKMYLTFSNNPNGQGKGKTHEESVVVFTYKTVVNKVDEEEKPLQGAEFTLEKKMAGESGETWKTVSVLGTDGTMTTFEFKGLDDGTYRLSETKTPSGYNTMEPLIFTVEAGHSTKINSLTGAVQGEGSSGEIELQFTSVVEEGTLSADVVNQKGASLPETGGIGTKIFYTAGTILVVGAGILLVARKRMKNEK